MTYPRLCLRTLLFLISFLLFATNNLHAITRHDSPRGSYGNPPDLFFGPAGVIISDQTGPLLMLTSVGRCNSTIGGCAGDGTDPPVIYLYRIQVLRDLTQEVTISITAPFSVAGDGSDVTIGIITDDQTYVAACGPLATTVSPPPQALVTCLAPYLDSSSTLTNTSGTQTLTLVLAANLKTNDQMLLHVDSFAVPGCSPTLSDSTAVTDCTPDAPLLIPNLASPSKIYVVGPAQTASSSTGAPVLTTLSQNSTPAFGANLSVTLTGTGFDATSTALWNGTTLSLTAMSSTTLTATIPASDLTTGGVARISVLNGSSGLESNSLDFEIVGPQGQTITLATTSIPQQASPVTVKVQGSQFLPNAAVQLSTSNTGSCSNQNNRPSFFVTAEEVDVTLYVGDVTQPNSYFVFILNAPVTQTDPPSPSDCGLSGGVSNPASLTVAAASIASLSSASVSFGNQQVGTTTSPAQILTVTNTGGLNLNLSATSIVGADPADFTIGPSSTCAPGSSLTTTAPGNTCTFSLTFTPTHAGSRTASLQITDDAANSPQMVGLSGMGVSPVPTLNPPLVPASITAGSASFPLTLNGSGFTADSTVNFGSNPALMPSTQTTSQLVVTVPASDVTAAGIIPVTVSNPGPPGGGTTASVNFTVNNPPPSIASLNPTSGLAGTPVTITGANFGASQGTSTVTFNGTAATPTAWSATAITAPVPATALTGNVVVTVGGTPSNGQPFTVTTGITITGSAAMVTTTSGASGTMSTGSSTITVTPSGGFSGAVTVNCGSLPGVTCTSLTIPAGSTKGTLTVNVTNPSTSMTAMLTPTPQNLWAANAPPHRGSGKGWWTLSAGTGFATLLLLFLPGRKRYRGALGLAVICAVSFAIGCGGGSSGGGGTGGGGGTSPTTTTTQLTVSATKVPFSGGITVSATVTGGTPSGNVQFVVDGAALGSPVPVVSGTTGNINVTAVQAPSFLQLVGTHIVSAHYLGDASTQASSSGTLNVTVTGTTNLPITAASGNLNAAANVSLTIQ
jgi:hypothetical protein